MKFGQDCVQLPSVLAPQSPTVLVPDFDTGTQSIVYSPDAVQVAYPCAAIAVCTARRPGRLQIARPLDRPRRCLGQDVREGLE